MSSHMFREQLACQRLSLAAVTTQVTDNEGFLVIAVGVRGTAQVRETVAWDEAVAAANCGTVRAGCGP
jgi:hypothetical protein